MAQFDITQTVHKILSSRGGTAQELGGNVIRTAAHMANLPSVDLAGLARLPGVSLPGVGDALRTAQKLGGALGRLGAPGSQAPAPSQTQKKSQFNPFDPVATQAAMVMASELMKIADRKGGDAGLADAIGALAAYGEMIGEISGLVGDLTGDLKAEVGSIVNAVVGAVGTSALGMIGLRQHALRLFITHYPPAHDAVKLEPFDQREPNLVSRFNSSVTPSEESKVSFWREDSQLNDHHGQWHAVYWSGANPSKPPAPPSKVLDRNGELFAYMHMQMLARYDAERLCAGLDRVKPFDVYTAQISEGYDPGPRVMSQDDGTNWTKYTPRPKDKVIKDIPADGGAPALLVKSMEDTRDVLFQAAQKGSYDKIKDKQVAMSIDNFGNTIESSPASVDQPDYGNLHGDGHVHFGLIIEDPKGPPGALLPRGVMLNLSTTSRDPIFWRWHKHIDTIIQTCRKTLGEQGSHDFAGGPPVTVRSQDIIICRQEELPADVDGGKLGAMAFGHSDAATGNRWDTNFSSGPATVTLPTGKTVTVTNELSTEMRKHTIHPVDPNDTTKILSEDVYYLSHEDFSYFIRLQNHSEQAQHVTIRVFLAPEAWVADDGPYAKDNTVWIELDRFLYRLEGHERAVACRPARLSAVVRKPALGHEELEGTKPRPAATSWCDCGWPYTLLLPRGTKEGMDFRLVVVLTSDDLAMDDTGQKCTSMSYCGLQDKNYPDKRPMGYPFDRPLTDSVSSIIEKNDNWASRKIRLRCRNPELDSIS